ncbi:hypothetical protein AB0L53_04640 [Nonomuraea sp. NPDC052129]|uniref:hypothetical protein n=1 Tax=Nonomuraea sp. NPDC052129 TaxID=3154651 RepID=UPI0034162E20
MLEPRFSTVAEAFSHIIGKGDDRGAASPPKASRTSPYGGCRRTGRECPHSTRRSRRAL